MLLNKQRSLVLLGTSAALGISTDILVRQEIFGFNFLLWTLLWTSILSVGLFKCKRLNLKTVLYVLFAISNAVIVYFRVEPIIQVWSVLATLSFMGLLFASLYLNNFFNLSYVRRASEYFGGSIVSFITTLGAISKSFRGMAVKIPKKSVVTPGIVVGTFLVVLFIALFSSADQIFSKNFTWLGDAVEPLSNWLNSLNIGRFISILFFAVSALAWLSMIISRHTVEDVSETKLPKVFSSKDKQVILGSVCVIFAIFVAVQLRFLFGGAELPSGLTFADYARSGYGQLLVATTLASGVVYVLKNATRDSSEKQRSWLSILLLVLNALVVVSAWKRLSLYESAYGWTMTRFVARLGLICIMAGILYLLIWVAGKISTRKLVSLCWYTLAVVLLGAAILNPVGVITKRNIVDLPTRETVLDVVYLSAQSADSYPAICKFGPVLKDKYPVDYNVLVNVFGGKSSSYQSGKVYIGLSPVQYPSERSGALSAHFTRLKSFSDKYYNCLK